MNKSGELCFTFSLFPKTLLTLLSFVCPLIPANKIRSTESIAMLRQASNNYKRGLESAKLPYDYKTRESVALSET